MSKMRDRTESCLKINFLDPQHLEQLKIYSQDAIRDCGPRLDLPDGSALLDVNWDRDNGGSKITPCHMEAIIQLQPVRYWASCSGVQSSLL